MKEIYRLYVEYKADLYHYLLGLTRNPTTADDLLSETFLKAIISLPTYRGDSTIKTWLFGIARNLWLQQIKKQKPTVEYDDLIDIGIEGDLLQSIISSNLAVRINELLNEKDDKAREILKMRMQGYSYSIIAQKLNISENSARVIEFRIKKWLKQALFEEGYL
jgi:RNA polymerase sigma-70 factor (ECF subfamily)